MSYRCPPQAIRPGVYRPSPAWLTVALLTLLSLSGCADNGQSPLHVASDDARQIASLFWVLAASAAAIWLAVIGVLLYAARSRRVHTRRTGTWLIVGGGVVVPVIALGALLAYSLPLLPQLSSDDDATLTINVSGEQWWWRVSYLNPSAENSSGPVELANEVRLPVGERALFLLSSPDVIHSFWIPALGGKVDMIPGRETRLAVTPTELGTYRGVCAEYCGSSHALMTFTVVVMERADFDRWLMEQTAPAVASDTRGRAAFLANGCGACHTVRGTSARGRVGPDLTHVGSRLSLAAGILPNEADHFARWIADPAALKPGVKMPGFGMLPATEIAAMARYLDGLE